MISYNVSQSKFTNLKISGESSWLLPLDETLTHESVAALFKMQTKKCWRCKAVLDISLFGKLKSSKDGLDNQCKPCKKIVNSKRHPDFKPSICTSLDGETWKIAIGVDGYMVSNLGRVKSIGRWVKGKRVGAKYVHEKILNPHIKNNRGYERVQIMGADGKRRLHLVHRLVAVSFIPNPNLHPFVNHIDGNRNNNRIENLEWCTPKQNVDHAMYVSWSHNNPKVSRDEVLKIRELYKEEKTLREISRQITSVKYCQIGFIAHKISWKDI